MADAAGKLLEAVLLPPGLFAVLVAVALVLLLRGSKRAWVPLAAALALLLALSTSPASTLLARSLERAHPPLADGARYDCVVVLAGGILDGSPEEDAGATLSRTSVRRVVYAYDLYRRKPGLVVVCGGARAGEDGPTEADLMADRLRAFGVGEGDLMSEAASANTMENARRFAAMAELKGLERIALVTSAMHMPRAVRAFESQGVEVVSAPTDYRAGAGFTWRGLLPSSAALDVSMDVLHELFGSLYYAVAYR